MPSLTGDIEKLINNTFGRSDKVNVKFIADNTLGPAVDGKLIGANFTGTDQANLTIGINPDVLTKSSKEYILVTLYHEAMHAFIEIKRKELDAVAFKAQFGELSSNGGRTLFTEVNGHFEMGANNYLNGLRDAIRDFNPNFDINRATALARAGIVIMGASDASINAQERDTTKPGFTGTKCP